ncbi:SDR family oxidoreductase [Aeromicrobium fastidiosum]|uniref:SDR family oxidoreductase n=1 Tax=Aeromicrobium fastidiosum TaxID=52699 RepID=A0A641ASB1_9ACTN|nr:SDR family oxidoreductase [Aeromicrobium fastidiosum]KAA1380849.1 SDR family oxidoreductase [Aeromicrobium fastidiosum]MBP2390477.1 3-oxoacyl-[acyl-carrier protein] reductase [Aeromicrobium fastidiosum]
MDLGLTDRTYILTGASGGLGLATAQQLVADGANVVISSRSQESVDRATAELGPRAIGVAVDNADATAPAQLIAAAQEAFGRIDGVLISVGGPAAGPIMDRTEDEWRTAFESVFLGAVRLATEVAEVLGDGGSIAFVLSTSVKAPIAGLGISNGLRPGLAMAAKTLADELGPRGIRVNALLPGRISTDRVRSLDEATGDADLARTANERTIPLGRYGEPEEFGRAAAFLLSPAASFLTGVMLPVDGGLTRAL